MIEIVRCPTRQPSSGRPRLGWWVATVDGTPSGRVELVLARATADGEDERSVALVTRLFVAPPVRRRGIGSALLETALRHAQSISMRTELDVRDWRHGAIALYEGMGWERLRTRPDGLHRYVGPS